MKITVLPEKTKLKATYTKVVFEERENILMRERGDTTTLVVGRPKTLNARTFRTLIRTSVRTAKLHTCERITFSVKDIATDEVLGFFTRAEALRTFAENALLAHYEFSRYKTIKKEKLIAEIALIDAKPGDKEAVAYGVTVATYVNHARDLANTPGGDMTPQVLARGAEELAEDSEVSVTVLNKRDIEDLNMGALLGVAKGSTEYPCFIVMEYWGAGKPEERNASHKKQGGGTSDENNPIVFVGKGITFDTGGLNLKPTDSVLDMHMDMSGGAAVIATIVAASKLGIKKNIVALIPAAENMVSGESYRPGDVLTSMSGKTIDVLNTDAEGRLVLADALTYAERYKPRLVVDVATLTGAACVALGFHASIVMTKDSTLETTLRAYGEKSGDYVWPLPLWDEYKQYTRGIHGDIANIPATGARYGGAINGGMFLSFFADKYPWAHIDMAPRMTSVHSDQLAKGATGEPVRLLLAIAENY